MSRIIYGRKHPLGERIAEHYRARGHEVEIVPALSLSEHLSASRRPSDLLFIARDPQILPLCHKLGYHPAAVVQTPEPVGKHAIWAIEQGVFDWVPDELERLIAAGDRALTPPPRLDPTHIIISGVPYVGKSSLAHRLRTSPQGGHRKVPDTDPRIDICPSLSPRGARRTEREGAFMPRDTLYSPDLWFPPEDDELVRDMIMQGHISARVTDNLPNLSCVTYQGLAFSKEHLGAPGKARCIQEYLDEGRSVMSLISNPNGAYRLYMAVRHQAAVQEKPWRQRWYWLVIAPEELIGRYVRRNGLSWRTHERLLEYQTGLFKGTYQESVIKKIAREQGPGETKLARRPDGGERIPLDAFLAEELVLTPKGVKLQQWLRTHQKFESLEQRLPQLIRRVEASDVFMTEQRVIMDIIDGIDADEPEAAMPGY